MKRISNIEKKYVIEALENQFSSSKNNVFTSKMEKKFAEIFMSNFAISHVNGTATMHTALHALDVREGDEVIVPPLTMASTSLCVLQNKSIPVFADVDINTFNIDPKSILEKITDKTRAIITVSLYGLSPEYDEILKICKMKNIHLIEDNAECFLGYYKGKLVGTFGDFSSYSFQASKHITTGEGGMLTTNDIDLANKARRFTSLGYGGVGAGSAKITKDDIQSPDYNRHVSLGYNYRMSEVQSAVILGQLERINQLVDIRKKSASYFDDVISENDCLIKQANPNHIENSFWGYAVYLDSEKPEKDWFDFRKLFLSLGGDPYYAAWKLTYHEDYFKNEVQKYNGIWQNFSEDICPKAFFLQKRIKAFKTNYWNIDQAKKQAEILHKTLKLF